MGAGVPDLRSNPEDRIVSLGSIAEHTAMPKYNFLLCSGRSRVKYPKSFHLMDIEAARQVGFRIAQTTLMFAISSSRQQKSSGLSGQRLRIAAPGQSRRHDPETTVDHPLIRGSKPQDLMRRGAASV